MTAFIDPKKANENQEPDSNNPDEVIDTPEKVEETNDEKIDEDFPGYPHYPAKDDMLGAENSAERVDLDVENLTRSNTISPDHIESIKGTPALEPDFTQADDNESEDIGLVAGTDADVTAEDLMILGDRDQDMDMGEDEELKVRGWQPVTGKDLDIPDADLDGKDSLGQGDEENSYYSLGGDDMQNLEESNDQNNF